jgi:hypothetical protein
VQCTWNVTAAHVVASPCEDRVMAHELLPSQQNDVFRAIQEAGFDPNEFEWHERMGDFDRMAPVPTIVHVPTGYLFLFDWNGGHLASYSPGRDRPYTTLSTGGWANQLGAVSNWLRYLAREYHAPDLWGELTRQHELADAAIEPIEEGEDRPFTLEEQAEIAQQLTEIKERLAREEQLTGQRLQALEAGIEYLLDASKRAGRQEWLKLFYGTALSWALGGLVSPDGVRQVIMLAAHGLGHLFGTSLPQLPPQ